MPKKNGRKKRENKRIPQRAVITACMPVKGKDASFGYKKASHKMKIIVGLGNPGLSYRNTRHNAGFLAVKALAKKHGLGIRKRGFKGTYGVGSILKREVILFEPMTYMNLSGEAVNAVCSSKLKHPEDLIVISDDISLPFGEIRLREKGSSGGHNGLQSIIDNMGSDFARLRMGIGSENLPKDVARYVLAPFSRAERTVLGEMLEKSVECVETWLESGIKTAMNICNKGIAAKNK